MAFKVGLSGGRELVASHVPGHKRPYLGIKHGNTFVAVAQFISNEDMEFMFESMQEVFMIPVEDES